MERHSSFLAATSLLLTIGIVYAAFSVKYIPYILYLYQIVGSLKV